MLWYRGSRWCKSPCYFSLLAVRCMLEHARLHRWRKCMNVGISLGSPFFPQAWIWLPTPQPLGVQRQLQLSWLLSRTVRTPARCGEAKQLFYESLSKLRIIRRCVTLLIKMLLIGVTKTPGEQINTRREITGRNIQQAASTQKSTGEPRLTPESVEMFIVFSFYGVT